MLNNKSVLITGGTGSFGNLFVETVLYLLLFSLAMNLNNQ